jgi:uncharacterized alpha-E superfamily protein
MEALRVLEATRTHMTTMTGAQTDHMTRDDGWRLLSIGRHIERLGFYASALLNGSVTGSMHSNNGFEAMVALFDSTITFHGQFQQSRDIAALLDLLVLDLDNPRALAWVAKTLRGRLAKLNGDGEGPQDASPLAQKVPMPARWSLEQISQADGEGRYLALEQLLAQTSQSAYDVSDEISYIYFLHSRDSKQSLGA